MLRKLGLLFGVSIIFMGICCSDYVQAKEVTAKSSLELVLEDDRTKLWIENNSDRIEQLRKEYDQIQVRMEGTGEIPYLAYQNEKMCGAYPQMVELLSAVTGIPCIMKEAKEPLEDNYTDITNHNVDLLLGVTLPKAVATGEKNVSELNKEGLQLTRLEGSIYENALVLAVPLEKNYTREQLSYEFWGALMEYDSTIMGTMLADHTIEYNTYDEMEEAFTNNEIQGMYIPNSKLSYEQQIENKKYQGLEFTKVNANEYFMDATTSRVLTETVCQVAELYNQLYQGYYADDNAWMIKDNEKDISLIIKTLEIAGCIGGAIVIVSLLLVFGIKQYTKRQFEKMLEQIPKNESKWEDILFVDLRNKKIQSKFGFSFYGLPKRFRKKRLPLKEMTKRIGFDFTKYYEYIRSKQETEFVHEFELYIQGVQYHYVETGVVNGKKVASRIYRK